MARDISKIKQQALRRDGKFEVPTQDEPLEEIQTPLQDTVLLAQKARLNKKLEKAIKNKHEELETATEAVKSILEGAKEETDRMVNETKIRAVTLISQAKRDRSFAEKLLADNLKKKNELKELEDEVSKRETDIKERGDKLTKWEEDVKVKNKNVDKLLKTASEQKVGSVEIFANSVILFEKMFEQFSNLQKLNSQLPTETSQTLEKAGRIMQRTSVLVKGIDIDKFALKEKAHELQRWQDGLVDREKMLDRTAKELKQYGKRNI